MKTTVPSQSALLGVVVLSSVLLMPLSGRAHEGMEEMSHEHHHAVATEKLKRSQVRYEVPDVMLTDVDGKQKSLRTVLADKSPLMLNFIFTTCTSICPVMSGVFSQVQARLGKENKPARMVSISIDPEQDTPARLKDYAHNFAAGPDWIMLTGRLADSIAVQRAFDAYRGDKMNHEPTTYLRAAPDQPWIRLDGLASANDLLSEYWRLASQ